MKKIICALSILLCAPLKSMTFKEAVEKLHNHEALKSSQFKVKALKELARSKGSWGDPMLKVAAKNFPQDSLRDDQTPMTGIEFGLSQKFSLSNKFGDIEESYNALSSAKFYETQKLYDRYVMHLWEAVIAYRLINEEIEILEENSLWIDKNIKVSKRLYANGKISQQALLEIQIRKSEIDSLVFNKNIELTQVSDRIKYFLETSNSLDFKSIPWQILDKREGRLEDLSQLALKETIRAKELQLRAAKKSFIPDVTFAIGYTKRSDIDGNGDFVSASISMPLPLSSTKYAELSQKVQEKYAAQSDHKDYNLRKLRDAQIIKKDLSKLQNEIDILNNKTIKFARNSRSITTKSYGLGRSSYIELLQSELKLQNILLKKVRLVAMRDSKKIALRFLNGEKLYE